MCELNLFSASGQPIPGDFPLGGSSQGCDMPGGGAKMILQSNSKYIQDIRQRLAENAREQRDKRQDRFLVEQLKAHEAREVKLLLSLRNVNVSNINRDKYTLRFIQYSLFLYLNNISLVIHFHSSICLCRPYGKYILYKSYISYSLCPHTVCYLTFMI